MKTWKWILLFALTGDAYLAVAADLNATIRSDSHNGWILESGGIEYRLGQDDGKIYLAYFGPAGLPDWNVSTPQDIRHVQHTVRYDIAGMAEGESLSPEDLELISQQELHP
jgi:hypothetical protein